MSPRNLVSLTSPSKRSPCDRITPHNPDEFLLELYLGLNLIVILCLEAYAQPRVQPREGLREATIGREASRLSSARAPGTTGQEPTIRLSQ